MKDIILENKERFMRETPVDREKIAAAMDRACAKIKKNIEKYGSKFPGTCSEDFKYKVSDRFNWESGMLTGCFWLAYEHTGDEVFKNAALEQIEVYKAHAKTGEWLQDHDTGFIFTPSCVAGYKITGDEDMRKAALEAADIMMDHYDWENHFIIRSGKRSTDPDRYPYYRTLVDSMMNIPLFFFAHEQTGDKKYLEAAVEHYRTTMKYLIREDGSSYHHYQFDPVTGKPVKGVTLQGYSDESCWGRGHSWLIYGFPIAYSYTHNEEIIPVDKNVSYFYLNKLAADYIPYWDFDFIDGSGAARDSSIAAITSCGFLEMCKYLPDDAEQKKVFKNAADAQINALIDKCENHGDDADGLILQVTHALPQGQGIEECAVYGDYFYMETLMRYLNPDWKRYW